MLDDLSWARGDLKESAKLYNGVDTSNLIPSTYTIDLVSPETLLLCRIIQLADYELSKLYAAQLNNQITVYDRYAMMRPFLMAYEVFKRHVLKLKSRTMDEMLSDGEEF